MRVGRKSKEEGEGERGRLYGANQPVTGALNSRAEAVGSACLRRPLFLPPEGEAPLT